jgi:DNA-binding NarL/FixJ family response regulator
MSDRDLAQPLRVMLVEDHHAFRQALTFILNLEPDFTVVAEADSLATARAVLEKVDFAIVDLALPDGNGADLIEDLWRANPGVIVLILSATLDEANIVRAVDAGGAGVVDKLAGANEIVQEARRVRAGATMPRQTEVVEMLRTIASHGGQDHEVRPDARLTARETEVLRALVEGLDNEGVAEKLDITLEEEQNHLASILEKLEARSSLQALVIAARRGVIEFP